LDLTVHPLQQNLLDQPFNTRLFLEGPAGAGKTTAGVLRLLQMLDAGVPGEEILVLTPQRTLAIPYEDALRSPQAAAGGPPTLLTLGGMARRMLELFWPLASEAAGFAAPDQPPVFLTLETAQYYMSYLVRPLLEEQHLFDSVSLDRNRLYSQILDNLNKAAVVGFPPAEIGKRLKAAWLGGVLQSGSQTGEASQLHIYEDVQTCADLFRAFCLQHNLLDFSLQVDIFRGVLWELPACRDYLQRSFRHLIYDNVEEDTPFSHDLARDWLPQLDSALLIFDWEAGYRRFLGADPQSGYALKELCNARLAFPDSVVQSDGVRALEARLDPLLALPGPAHFLFSEGPPPADRSLKDRKSEILNPETAILNLNSFRFYPEMMDWAADTIAALVEGEGLPPGEIVVLAPFLSDALRFSLMDRLTARGVPSRSHRPSRSLREEPATECLLTLSALAHPEWGIQPSRYDVAYTLVQAIQGLDLVRAQLLAKIVYQPRGEDSRLTSFDRIIPEVQERITYSLGERFERLRQWLEASRGQEGEFDQFLSRLFGELLSQPGFGFHTNYDAGQAAANLIESAQNFRLVAGPVLAGAGVPLGKEYLHMVEDGVIAAQYLENWRVETEEAVLLAPAYTFLVANRPVEVQFWLDAGSRDWAERLYQPLTHPYVLSRGWPAERAWTDADEYAAGHEALRRLALGLLRRCRRTLYLGLSELGEQGYEQRGPLMGALQRLLRQTQSAYEEGKL
jgi:hypothetical protein